MKILPCISLVSFLTDLWTWSRLLHLWIPLPEILSLQIYQNLTSFLLPYIYSNHLLWLRPSLSTLFKFHLCLWHSTFFPAVFFFLIHHFKCYGFCFFVCSLFVLCRMQVTLGQGYFGQTCIPSAKRSAFHMDGKW